MTNIYIWAELPVPPVFRYDAEGVGQSQLPVAEEVSYAKWFEDACYVIEHLSDGPQMLVSSSNGGQ